MPIERSMQPVTATRISQVAVALLNSSTLCAIATMSPAGRPYVNTAYFAFTRRFEIVWISEPAAAHSVNLESTPSAAIAVFDSHQQWGGADRGIQLFGSAEVTHGAALVAARRIYRRRFPEYRPEDTAAYLLYRFQARRLKLFDETTLGSGVFVSARVAANARVRWQRTEIYRPI